MKFIIVAVSLFCILLTPSLSFAKQPWTDIGQNMYIFEYHGSSGSRRQVKLFIRELKEFKETTCLEVKTIVYPYEGLSIVVAGPEWEMGCIIKEQEEK